jgi:hypothetical protein
MVGRLPNFFIVGAGKAGTTSLYHYLGQHPQIFMSPIKEPSYFASEIRAGDLSETFRRHVKKQSRHLRRILADPRRAKPMGWLVEDWDDYVALFANARDEIAIGEATPSYLWSETSARNIHARLPEARIVMLLRDPAERAFSQYMHQLAEGLTRYSFREQIERAMRPANGEPKLGILHPFLEVGLYHEQVRRYLALFPREQIRIYWYEEAWRDVQCLLADLFGFLRVDAGYVADTSRKSLERRAPRAAALHYFLRKYEVRELVPQSVRLRLRGLVFREGASAAMDPRDRDFLIGYYREDVRKLASLMDRDLSAWLR